ncbi:hypothetical protein EMIT0158MI4_140149 [Burkholderia ambifaria]
MSLVNLFFFRLIESLSHWIECYAFLMNTEQFVHFCRFDYS